MDEIIVDSFAGGGGASTGIELATGRPVDIAINHDPDAILMHKTNHPHTEHIQASAWAVDPVEVCTGGWNMRVLVACEESQEVCKAFRALGHEAYSCDIQPCSGGRPEWHIQADALELLKLKWDLIIAHPPCTYLTKAGAVRMRVNGEIVQERFQKAMEAKKFFLKFLNADCEHIAVENPTPMKIVDLPPYAQAIQPYQFGHPYSKRTCLWLKGLPLLQPTQIVESHEPYVNGGCKDAHGNYRRFQGRKERDPKIRAKTFPGIAKAMAEQWGGVCT